MTRDFWTNQSWDVKSKLLIQPVWYFDHLSRWEDGTRFLKSVKFSVNWWSKFLQKTPVEVVFVWLRELYNSSRRNMQMDEMKLFHSPQWMNPFQMAEQKYIVNSFLVMVGWNRTSPCNQSRAFVSPQGEGNEDLRRPLPWQNDACFF